MEGGVERMLVPSVKELAKECLESVPDRYIRFYDDQDRPIVSSNGDDNEENLQLPVIDMKALVDGDDEELLRLHSACQDWGFFQVINHGVSQSLVDKFKRETHQFFDLPTEEKKKYWQTDSDMEGFGQVFVVSNEQKLEWGDAFLLNTFPEDQRSTRLWPALPLPYRETMENYSSEVGNIVQKMLECMGKTLNIESEVMRELYGEQGRQLLRMNYYPPCPQPERVIGLTPHSDAALLTVLLQLNEVEGLQVWKHGKWVPVRPLPNAFTVNVGDILEMVTNGLYKSILHRVVVNGAKERLSVAAFHTPGNEKDIVPLPNIVTQQNPAKYISINIPDYLNGLFARRLNGKSYLDVMRITQNIA